MIARAAMGRTGEFFEYKAVREGDRCVRVDRFFPSSKTCSGCGSLKSKLALSERTFVCERCGLVLDRAVNLVVFGLAGSTPVSGRGGHVVLGGAVGTAGRVFGEASTVVVAESSLVNGEA